MFSFFVPVSKVQKDRRIMRETDMRMAKYSRRGLIVNFIAFLICLYGGRFVDENRELTIVLTIGLLLITFVRGIFLFRFDQLYPRAPNKWRNQYFIATLLGACWWSVIMCSITLVLEMQYEAPLFWLYTVVFFSTTANAFAPYQKFLSFYQLLGQTPAAIAVLLLGTVEAYLYSGLLLGFFFVLSHQCRLISENYWERLEVSYALTRKTISLEEEKKDTRASVLLNRDFLKFLVADFSKFVKEAPGQDLNEREVLYENIKDFQCILSKDLELKNKVFNIRHELQHLIAGFVDLAEEKGVQLESSLSPSLPMRLRGDSERLAGIVKNLISINLQNIQAGLLLVEAEFIREYEYAGELYITVSTSCDTQKGFFGKEEKVTLEAEENLAYVVSMGLAEIMDGSIEKDEIPRQGISYRFNAKIEIVDTAGQLDFHRNSFVGYTVMLVHKNAAVVDIKRQALESLGFTVLAETQYKRAINTLLSNAKLGKPIEALIFYCDNVADDALEFSRELQSNKELSFIKQFIAVSARQKDKLAKLLNDDSGNVYFIDKPMGLFELESTFRAVYEEFSPVIEADESSTEEHMTRVHCLCGSHAASNKVAEILQHGGTRVSTFNNEDTLIESMSLKPEIILIDLSEKQNVQNVVEAIRQFEREKMAESLIPVLGFNVEESAKDKVYHMGIDDSIDLNTPPKELINTIHYWASLNWYK